MGRVMATIDQLQLYHWFLVFGKQWTQSMGQKSKGRHILKPYYSLHRWVDATCLIICFTPTCLFCFPKTWVLIIYLTVYLPKTQLKMIEFLSCYRSVCFHNTATTNIYWYRNGAALFHPTSICCTITACRSNTTTCGGAKED